MDVEMMVEALLKSIFILAFFTVGFSYTTLFERKVLARMQVRIGPNRVGWQGFLQPVADGIKLIFKEELIPKYADKVVFILAPVLTVIPALVITAVIPWGTQVTIGGRVISLYLVDINVGVLYIMTIASIAVYGITLAGWASNNKYATLGGLRSTAQMISYELAQGLTFVVPILLANSMSLVDIVEKQRTFWFAVLQPGAALIFLIAGIAECNRAPFDMPEAEQELTAGFHVEYSGMKFALFFMAEYIKIIAISMIFATLFLGGYLLPFEDELVRLVPQIKPVIPFLGPVALIAKVLGGLFFFVWLRATLPRFRYDRLMAFGWKILFPFALLSVLMTAIVKIMVGG